MIVDYHMHLRDPAGDIDHTVEAVERFVDVAAMRGVDEIGFTEHVYYFPSTRDFWTPQYLPSAAPTTSTSYVDAVLEAKRQGLPVKLGLEVDYVGGGDGRTSSLRSSSRTRGTTCSARCTGSTALAVDMEPGIWATASVDEVWAQYFAALAELAASGHVDVLAHPDLAKIFGRRPANDRLSSPRRVALEISTAGLHKPVGELYPDIEMLAAASADHARVRRARARERRPRLRPRRSSTRVRQATTP